MRAKKDAWAVWLERVGGKEKAFAIIQQGVRNGTNSWAKSLNATKEELAHIGKVLDEAFGALP